MTHDIRRGAALMVLATLFTAMVNALQKKAGASLPVIEIVFFRNLFSLPPVLLMALRTKASFRTKRPGGHLLRSGIGLVSMVMTAVAVLALPLAEQQVFSYTQPLFLIILSIPLLGEVPSLRRWAAVAVGFCGVLVVALGAGLAAGQGGPVPLWAYGIALAQGLVGALTALQIRQLSTTEASTTIVFWQAVLMTLLTLLALPFAWRMPGLEEWALLGCIGLCAAAAQVLQTEAFASAQVSAIGPFTYGGLIWAGLLGWLFFDEVLSLPMLMGAALIVGAGLWMLRPDGGRGPP